MTDVPQFLKGQLKVLALVVVIVIILFSLGADINEAKNLIDCIKNTASSQKSQNCDVDWYKGILGIAVLITLLGYGAYVFVKVLDVLT